ncbi:MAG: PEP-CTERM sorting domain-containing protein [Parvularculaceae bacterium]|nr:PEP-CTERM sorting domain-containing protein [Parvularculaceae bacterium]
MTPPAPVVGPITTTPTLIPPTLVVGPPITTPPPKPCPNPNPDGTCPKPPCPNPNPDGTCPTEPPPPVDVPEPATWLILIAGVAAFWFGLSGRRRRA